MCRPSPLRVAPFLQVVLRALPQPAGQHSSPVVTSSGFVCPGGAAVSWGALGNLFDLNSFF